MLWCSRTRHSTLRDSEGSEPLNWLMTAGRERTCSLCKSFFFFFLCVNYTFASLYITLHHPHDQGDGWTVVNMSVQLRSANEHDSTLWRQHGLDAEGLVDTVHEPIQKYHTVLRQEICSIFHVRGNAYQTNSQKNACGVQFHPEAQHLLLI